LDCLLPVAVKPKQNAVVQTANAARKIMITTKVTLPSNSIQKDLSRL
jgi:hypothetical protein